AGLAVFVFSRRRVRRGGEARVTASAASTLGDDVAIAGRGEIVQQFARFGVIDHGANRCRKFYRVSVMSSLVAAFAVPPALGLMFGIKTEMEQGVMVLGRDHHHVAAASAVAPARPAARHKLFPPERKAAVAAVPRFDGNDDFIYEQHGNGPLWPGGRRYSAATTLTNLPMRPRSRNSMTPVTLA